MDDPMCRLAGLPTDPRVLPRLCLRYHLQAVASLGEGGQSMGPWCPQRSQDEYSRLLKRESFMTKNSQLNDPTIGSGMFQVDHQSMGEGMAPGHPLPWIVLAHHQPKTILMSCPQLMNLFILALNGRKPVLHVLTRLQSAL